MKEKGVGKWNEISLEIYFKSNGEIFINPSKCRERWISHLSPVEKAEEWKEEEDVELMENVKKVGNKWSTIAKMMGNKRSEHSIKNRFRLLSKKNKKNMEVDKEDQEKMESSDS